MKAKKQEMCSDVSAAGQLSGAPLLWVGTQHRKEELTDLWGWSLEHDQTRPKPKCLGLLRNKDVRKKTV